VSKLSRNVLYNFVGQSLVLLIGLVAVRFVFRKLGADVYGIIVFIQTVNFTIVAVLDLGITSTTVREVAAHFAQDSKYVRDLLRTAGFFFWSAYVTLAVAIVAFAPLVAAHWINLKAVDAHTATQMLQILGVASLVALPRSLYIALLRGLERMGTINLVEVGFALLQQSGTVAILAGGGGLTHLIYWLTLSYVLSLVVYSAICARLISWRALIPAYSSAVVKKNLRFSLNMLSISTLAMIHTSADKVVMSKLLPISALGYYGFASNLVSRSTLLTSAVLQAAFPSFSRLFQGGETNHLMRQYGRLQNVLAFGMVPLFAAVSFAALPLFGYLFTPGVAPTLVLPVALMCLGWYMNGTLTVPYALSVAMGRPDVPLRLNFWALFAVLPVTVLLVNTLALVGAALSWVYYNLFAYAYFVPKISRDCLGISPVEWYSHIGRVMALTAATYGVAGVALASIGKATVPYLIAGYAAASLAFMVGTYFMVGSDVKQAFLRLPWSWRTKAVPS
jgi:O-antigen/teichoic acid export membrane protein